jgi:hypothetical protein
VRLLDTGNTQRDVAEQLGVSLPILRRNLQLALAVVTANSVAELVDWHRKQQSDS